MLLATIAAPGMAPEATADSKVDSIEGIFCNLTKSLYNFETPLA